MNNSQIKKTIIFGLGITGLSCAEYLIQEKIPFIVFDSRKNPPNLVEFKNRFPNVSVYTEHYPSELINSVETILLSPGISKEDPLLAPFNSPKIKIMGDIELFSKKNNSKPVIAITGSNGKSTVTSLVGEMAKASNIKVGVGGNLGTPALALLKENPDLYVLELSSFQLETTESLKPSVSTILNICLDHMDRYKTLEEYYRAKARIFDHSHKIVINRDDSYILNHLEKDLVQRPTISFGLSIPSDQNFGVNFKTGELLFGATPLLNISELKIFGHHNVANALAALSLGAAQNFPIDAMLNALKTFGGLAHRCEWVRTLNEIRFVNDSKGTNVGATIASLEGLKETIPGKWILILGGIGKNADFAPLKKPILDSCRSVILLGEAKKELFQLLSPSIPCISVNNMEEAVQKAYQTAKPGDGVLLSPACASFDMFKHFEHRGQVFKDVVHGLLPTIEA